MIEPIQTKTFGDVVREYFPDATGIMLEFILWAKTGYPSFWNIPEDGNTVEECLRKQLGEFLQETIVYTHQIEVGEEYE